MIQIDLRSPVPIYDQIKAGLRGLVAKGLLKPGDQAPSIRNLAASLKVNPNTVARAFRELAQEGFLQSQRGDGAYISQAARQQAQERLGSIRLGLLDAFRHARRAGLAWEDIDLLAQKTREEEK